MRTAGSAVLIVVALLLAAVAGPSMWLQRNVVDGAGFAQLAGPLGSNKEFQEGLSALAASQATASLDLPPQLENLAAAVIGSAARGIYSDPGYEAAWTQTLERSHKLTFEAAGNPDIQGDLLLDIAPLMALVGAKVGADLGVKLPTPADVVVNMEQPNVARILPIATTLGAWGIWLALAAVVLLVVGVFVAPRRALALLLAGAGLAVVALVWLLGSGMVESILANLAVGPEAAKQVGVQLGALARNSWQGGITTTFVIAAATAAAGVATLMLGRRRTT